MKKILGVALLAIMISCSTEKKQEQLAGIQLTISSSIDQEDPLNQEVISTLKKFLQTKNDSFKENEYWLAEDFDTFWFPFQDIYKIEHKGSALYFYQPSLMEIVNTEEEDKKLLKLAFIGHNDTTKENTLKSIYNIVANKTDTGIVLSNPLHYFTRDWEKIYKGSIEYVVSPDREFNEEEAERQLEDVAKICDFFSTDPMPITYYSCVGLEELFQIKGFDYNPIMYWEGGGGLAANLNIVFSGNRSELYTHEIMHLYTSAWYPSNIDLIDEGLATYVGGSRVYSYTWHKKNLRSHIEEYPEIDFSSHLEPYERFFAGETSIPYMVGALVCERTYRLYGKAKLLDLLDGAADVWELLGTVGLTQENFDAELKKELLLAPTLCM
ncbi:hypothetical protein SAMN05661096_00184 [Marivirga sericea]|uniref:Peptidase MA superfamily protein n=1 Tax=Marivirga sericea TaxID=1028 RepID=A0A1X7I3U1_9BACT|nr:hypothetical protein [Marivirga sericea]SMG09062.1 hypothetical protein SAMN05661096_00184 [Marivirga sericea]